MNGSFLVGFLMTSKKKKKPNPYQDWFGASLVIWVLDRQTWHLLI